MSAAFSSLLRQSSISNDFSCSLIEARVSALACSSFAACRAALFRTVLGDAAGNGETDEGHEAAERRERQEGEARNDAEHRHQEGCEKERVRIAAELVDDRLVGRAARAALGDEQSRGERDDERGDLRDEAVADRELGKDVGSSREAQSVPRDADNDAAENVDRENDEAGDRIAAHEFRCAVHRAKEGAFFLELAPASLSDLFVDEACRQVGVDRHLLAGDRVEGEARADLGDAGRALGDDEEVDRHQNEKDDDADEEVAAHHQMREAADDVAGRSRPLGAAREDKPCGRDVEREPQDGRDQQYGWEGGEFERLLDP